MIMNKIIKKPNKTETKTDIKRNNMIKRNKSHKRTSNNFKKLSDHSSTREKLIQSIKPIQDFLLSFLPTKRAIVMILMHFKKKKTLMILFHQGNLNLSQLMLS